MACINPDGTLSAVARQVLSLLAAPHSAGQIAAATGLPLYRIRATLRETGRAGLIEASAEPGATAEDGPEFRLTALGAEALELDSG